MDRYVKLCNKHHISIKHIMTIGGFHLDSDHSVIDTHLPYNKIITESTKPQLSHTEGEWDFDINANNGFDVFLKNTIKPIAIVIYKYISYCQKKKICKKITLI